MYKKIRREIRSVKEKLLEQVRAKQSSDYNAIGITKITKYTDITEKERVKIRAINKETEDIMFDICYNLDRLISATHNIENKYIGKN